MSIGGRPRRARSAVRGWLDRPLASRHLVLATSALLTAFGLVMQLSASTVTSYLVDGSAYTLVAKQALFAVVGAALFAIALRVPVGVVRRISGGALAACVALLVLVLVPGVGHAAHGASKWFVLGPVAFQPAEPAKVALAVWGAHVVSRRRAAASPVRSLLLPLAPVAAVITALIVVEPDLGTALTVGIIVLALLWFSGAPLALFGAAVGTATVGAAVLAMTAGYRLARVTSFLDPAADPQGAGYQALQARYALAEGGLLGTGLGQGTAKWSYLPNAHNDFIFAVVGEELGLLGCAVLLSLLGVLALTGLRISGRCTDPFWQVLSATVTLWLVGQALINIGYVIGLLPVTGLTLPLVSAGGTSSATTLLVLGLLAAAARAEPPAQVVLSGHDSHRVHRSLPVVRNHRTRTMRRGRTTDTSQTVTAPTRDAPRPLPRPATARIRFPRRGEAVGRAGRQVRRGVSGSVGKSGAEGRNASRPARGDTSLAASSLPGTAAWFGGVMASSPRPTPTRDGAKLPRHR